MASAPLLEPDITCNVCYEVCEKPQCLKCLHFFCNSCIQKIKQGTKIQCPECRQTCSMSEVKKDFRIQKLIDQYRPFLKPRDVETITATVCDVCKNQRKPTQSYCKICEELLCFYCAIAHQGSKVTKHHELIAFRQVCEEKQMDIKSEMKLQDTKTDVRTDMSRSQTLLMRLDETEDIIIQEINHCRKVIQNSVDIPHDKLINEVKTINEKLKVALKENADEQCEKKLHDKISSLSQVCWSQIYPIMMETVSNLSKQIENYVHDVYSELPSQVSPHVFPSISDINGDKFDPKKSTSIEGVQHKSDLTSEAMVGGKHLRMKMHYSNLNFCIFKLRIINAFYS